MHLVPCALLTDSFTIGAITVPVFDGEETTLRRVLRIDREERLAARRLYRETRQRMDRQRALMRVRIRLDLRHGHTAVWV